MSGGTVVPRHECPGGHFFQGDSHASDTGLTYMYIRYTELTKRATVQPNIHVYKE